MGGRCRPRAERLVVDVDSFVGEVHGYDKQGAGFGYTHKRGYHPILATRAGTREVLHIRARKGSANTARGALRFVEEMIARIDRAGATGPKLLRADSILPGLCRAAAPHRQARPTRVVPKSPTTSRSSLSLSPGTVTPRSTRSRP